MWFWITSTLGMRWNPYDYEGYLLERPNGTEDLDPVPPNLPGCINIQSTLTAAENLACQPIITGVKVLSSQTAFEGITKPDLHKLPVTHTREGPKTSIGRNTAWMFLAYLTTLVTWQMLVENTDHKELHCLANFFTVAKANGLLRCIFDCRVLNSISETPPPVNLAPIPDIMKLAADIGVTHAVTSDFKHFFFQLGLPDGVQGYFGFRCNDKETNQIRYFRSRILSMGYSWSPYIAQCFSSTCILKKPAPPRQGQQPCSHLGIDYAEVAAMQSLPPYVLLRNDKGEVVGFVTVIYDNIGVFTKDRELAIMWSKRLLSNARALQFWFKEMTRAGVNEPLFYVDTWDKNLHGTRPPPKPLSSEEIAKRRATTRITFLGVEIDLRSAEHPFRWRHSPEKLDKWRKSFLYEPHTHRDVARIVGICVWDCVICDIPFSDISDAIGALRHSSRACSGKSDWDKPLAETVTKEILTDIRSRLNRSFLNRCLEKLSTNPWITSEPNTDRQLFLLASDATEERIAGVMLSESGRVIKHFGRGLSRTHVFVKECQAIDATVRWAQKWRACDAPAEFRLAVDNKAANAAARYCYSSNESVSKLFRNLHKFMKNHNIKLVVIDCHTKLNVADCPSRRKKITKQLAEATTDVLLGYIAGRPHEHVLIDPTDRNDTRPSVYLNTAARDSDVEVIEDLMDEPEQLWHDVNSMCDSHLLEHQCEDALIAPPSMKRPRGHPTA